MAKQKKKKWKYKFLTEEEFEGYKQLSLDELISALKDKQAFLEQKESEKKNSESLKSLNEEIKEFKEIWSGNQELQELKEAYENKRKERDQEIEDLIEDKKSIAGALADQVKGAQERRNALLYILRFHNP